MGGIRHKENQFTLFKRGKVWYYWTYDSCGKRFRYSTGETKKIDAFDYCIQLQSEHRLISRTVPKKAANLTEYGKDFWNYETCPIIQGKVLRGGHFGIDTAQQNQRLWDVHIEPFFRGKSPEEITYGMVDKWLLDLPKLHRISNKTANNCLVVFRQMLNQMVIDGYILSNPAERVKRLVLPKGRRDAFTPEQVRALLSEKWNNQYAYTACYLAAKTGMRLGEIRALTAEQVFPSHILVNASWADKEGRKSTKSGYERTVPITEEVYRRLKVFFPPEGGLIFTLNGEKPVNDKFITTELKRKMAELNKERGGCFFDPRKKLTFHSFRHFVNTRLLAADMPRAKIQAIIGHDTDEMTEHYAHLSVEDLKAFRDIQSMIDIA